MIVRTVKDFDAFLPKLAEQFEVIIDTETTGLDIWGKDRMCGIGFCFEDESTYYLPYRHKEFPPEMALFQFIADPEYNLPLETLPRLWEALGQVSRICGHNIKFDLAALSHDGYVVPALQEIEETLCGARIYFPDHQPDMTLEGITRQVLGEDVAEWKQKFVDYLEKRKIKNHYDYAEIPVVAEYCMGDVRYTKAARDTFRQHAVDTNQWEVYSNERELMSVLWEIECGGLQLDKEYIDWAVQQCTKACDELMGSMLDMLGDVEDLEGAFNPWSNPQLTLAFDHFRVKPLCWNYDKKRHFTPPPEDCKKWSVSWADEALARITHPFAKLVLDWRAVDKMMNTFFLPYQALADYVAHPTFKSWGAVTGRFSCSNPNLQQVSRPVDWKDEGFTLEWFDVQVRKMFIAPEGFKLVLMDYSQMEMIGFADYLDDENLRARLNAEPTDFHALVATMIFKVDEFVAEFKKLRSRAKAISLGLVYMMGIKKLAKSINVTEDEATEFRSIYFRQFPTANDFIWNVVNTAKTRGYVFNRFGRRYYLDDEHFAYKMINYLVQGTCADIIKLAMIRLRKMLMSYKSRLAFQMHDEFGFYIHETEWHLIKDCIEIMEDVPIKTKMFVEVSVAANSWAEKKQICKECLEIAEKGHSCGDPIHIEQESAQDFIDPTTGFKLPSYSQLAN